MELTTSKEAYELVSNLISLQRVRRKIDVERGRLLYQLHANRLYLQAYGDGVDTWEEFLRSPEIGLTVSEANRAMQLYEYFVIKFKIPEQDLESIPVRTLTHLLPKLKLGQLDSNNVTALIEDAKGLTFFEFKERLQDVQAGTARTYTYMVMKKCNETNNLSKVIGISSEELLNAFPQINDN